LIEIDTKKSLYQDCRLQTEYADKHKSKVRMQVVKQNIVKRDVVREDERRIHERLIKRELDKKRRNQLSYSMRIEDQKRVISKVDNEICAMEVEERETLERLKNSQQLEQNAYKDLENAIKTSVDKTEWRKKQMHHKHRLPINKHVRSHQARSISSSVYDQGLH
jgi:hypothetical protein